MAFKYNGKNIVLARNLRKNSTRQENHLWYEFLSKYEIPFQRQKVIGDFIVDFYCYRAKLIIELDGSQHRTLMGINKDRVRTEILKEYGLKVIRFTNEQIDKEFLDVCQQIDEIVKSRI